jgi:hypothetical protein
MLSKLWGGVERPAPDDLKPRKEPGVYFECSECDSHTPDYEWPDNDEGFCAACDDDGEDAYLGDVVTLIALTDVEQKKDDRYAGKVNMLVEYGSE